MALTTTPSELTATALTLTTAAQPNITSVGTLTTLTVDDITINGSTISDAGDLTLDVANDIILDADSGVWRFKDAGTTIFQVARDGNSYLGLYSGISDMDMRFQGNDGGSTVTALTLDMSAAGAATFNTDVTTGGKLTVSDGGNATVAAIRFNAGLGISSPTTDQLNFITADTTRMVISSAGLVGIGTDSPGGNGLHIKKDTDTDYVVNTATINNVLALQNATAGAGNNVGISFSTESNGEVYLTAVENASNSAADFRIGLRDGGSRSDVVTVTSAGQVGINNTNPGDYNSLAYDLVVGTNSGNHGITISSGTHSSIYFADGYSGNSEELPGYVQYNHPNNTLTFGANGTARVAVGSGSSTALSVTGRILPSEHMIFGSNQSYIQIPSGSSGAWAIGTSGGAADPGNNRDKFGLHRWSGSAWSNPLTIDASDNVRINSHIRATGWWNTPTGDGTADAAEIGFVNSHAYFIGYDRANSHYTPVMVKGSTVQIENTPTAGQHQGLLYIGDDGRLWHYPRTGYVTSGTGNYTCMGFIGHAIAYNPGASGSGTYMHIKTNCYKNDRMFRFKYQGYGYSSANYNSSCTLYTYSGTSTPYQPNVDNYGDQGWTNQYYSSDSYVVIVITVANNYTGGILWGQSGGSHSLNDMAILSVKFTSSTTGAY